MSRVSESIMRGLQEALADAEGKRQLPMRTYTVMPVRDYDAHEVKEIRHSLGMSQSFFALFMGVSKKTVEAWESGRNMPDGPARRILSMIQADPELPMRYSIVEA